MGDVCTIYKYTNKITGKIYIGQTWRDLKERAGSNGSRYKRSHHFYNAIQKYGWSNFECETLEICSDQESADNCEDFYIKKYNSCDPSAGYNLKFGGSAGKHSDATRKKMSEIKLNLSDEARKNMSKAHKGIPLAKEHAEAISRAGIGRVFSQETRRKISESQLNKIIPIEVRNKISESLTGKKQSVETIEKRTSKLRGKNLPKNQKITDEQIVMILADDRSCRKIAKDYGVCHDTISRIKSGKRKPNKEE